MKKTLYVMAGLAVIVVIAWTAWGCLGSNTSRFQGPTSAEEPLPAALISDLESVFVGKTLTLATDSRGKVTMRWPGDEAVYRFAQRAAETQLRSEPGSHRPALGDGPTQSES